MKRWKGRFLIGNGIFHGVLGIILFVHPLYAIAQAGVWNSLGLDPLHHLAFWFMIDSIWSILLGLLADWVEGQNQGLLPQSLGWGVLMLAVIGIMIMPISGFWLLLPVAIGILVQTKSEADSLNV